MNFNVEIDERSWEQIALFQEGSSLWHNLFGDDLANELAKKAIEHMKPMTHVRPSTGDLAKSLTFKVLDNGNGFTVDFYGLSYGNLVDAGNFDGVIYAEDKGLIAFPIRPMKGATPILFSKQIHGMGSYTPGAPTHFLEKTAQWLGEGEANRELEERVSAWLNSVVIR